MKKFIALTLATVMLFALCACKPTVQDNALSADDVIKVVTQSHPSWPNDTDSKAWQYIREGTGVNLEVQAIPQTDYSTKLPLIFADANTLPDLIAFGSKPLTDTYAEQGALIALDELGEHMPEYNAYISSLPEDEREGLLKPRRAYDGKIYYSPTHGRERMQGVRAWLYRKDIFDKHNIAVPTTMDELYSACKKLKELYPESYPFCMRSGMAFMCMIGSSWKEYFEVYEYYDYNNDEWNYGATEDTMLDMITYFKRMVDEKLIPADFFTINTTTWQELITTDKGFIFPDYQTRIDFFTPLARVQNPEFTLTAMAPPVADAEEGASMLSKYNIDPYGYVICNTKDEERIAKAAKFLDWFYSAEAEELLSWGKEGETYNVVGGKRVYITDETGAQPNTLYGFSTPGTVARFDPEAVDAFESELLSSTRELVLEHTVEYPNPKSYLGLTVEEQKIKTQDGAAIEVFVNEMVAKFVLGQEPLTGFDAFVEDVNEMGVDRVLEVYENAYNRIK